MLSIAARTRPSVAGALLFSGIAILPWADDHRFAVAPLAADVVTATRPDCSADWHRCYENRPSAEGSIILTPWDRVQLEPQHFEVLVPPQHPDARDYPLGMVMGRHTPSVDPGIQQWFGSPFANVLSVLVAPWQALAHQLGT